MISIVICSTSTQIAAALQKNIEEKIGVPYEIIGMDNSENKYSIFSAYNEGVAKSKYDIICFIHEDVFFHTTNWGLKVLDYLSDSSTGIIGICGCATLSKIPSPWSLYEPYKYIIQSTPSGRKQELQQSGFDNSIEKKEVIAVDGVFMCARKDLFQKIRFDEEAFNGYHSYDIDICLQARMAGYKNYFVNDILIEHFSKGYHSKGWIINSMTLTDKWIAQLPISLNPVSSDLLKKMEYNYMTVNFAKYLIRAGYSNVECTRLIAKFLHHHAHSDSKSFICKIYLKTLWVRLLKKPLSFFLSLS
ncbi:MAG TPA: glycosyltransferase [Bacteroidales bacterium]|nr:glycosyltransferase [Bacteroidales bacterium]